MAETEAKTAEQAMGEVFDSMHAPPEAAPVAEVAPVEAAPVVEAPKVDRARDEAGKFVKAETVKSEAIGKTPEKPAVTPATAAKAPEGPGKEVGAEPSLTAPASDHVSSVKAPQAWSPQAREAFAKAPPEVQREVDKREREITRTLSETAQVRQFAQGVQESLRAYEPIARQYGQDAFTWAGEALSLAAPIYSGNPRAAAQAIVRAIQVSGADLDTINSFLQAGPQGPPSQTQAHAYQPPSEDAIIAKLEAKWEAQKNQQMAQEFLANPPEFWGDVQEDAIELIRLDRMRGGNMTPQQAYDKAVKFNEGVQSALAQRKAAEAAKKQQADLSASKAAATSVRSQPAGPAVPGKKSSVEAMSEMYDQIAAGRR